MTLEQQQDILDHTHKLLTDFCGGIPPKGSVAPWWETSKEGTKLLLEKGIEYDHSNMAHDCQAYYLRDEDTWFKISYDQKPDTWMKPLTRGNETGLVEIPANWYLDDLPPMMFIKNSPNSHGWVNARDVEQLWKDTFAYCYSRPHVLLMLERFIEWINTHENVHWVPMIEMANEFRQKNKAKPGAVMPKGFVQN
ncbi:hypothetical protein Clacol_007603 [Clathrus columnatus]|uniref:Uncharacterized protein n=1 Tax=Clathrus columnatus TaxID=1419009 RepID=A0AAV5AFC9_9AGAM|nr:hypothetical protein Clacol_007603 [Clathrus columnatus]